MVTFFSNEATATDYTRSLNCVAFDRAAITKWRRVQACKEDCYCVSIRNIYIFEQSNACFKISYDMELY